VHRYRAAVDVPRPRQQLQAEEVARVSQRTLGLRSRPTASTSSAIRHRCRHRSEASQLTRRMPLTWP